MGLRLGEGVWGVGGSRVELGDGEWRDNHRKM